MDVFPERPLGDGGQRVLHTEYYIQNSGDDKAKKRQRSLLSFDAPRLPRRLAWLFHRQILRERALLRKQSVQEYMDHYRRVGEGRSERGKGLTTGRKTTAQAPAEGQPRRLQPGHELVADFFKFGLSGTYSGARDDRRRALQPRRT